MDNVDPKEVLGFDPITGQRNEDSSGNAPYTKAEEGYSEEVISRFNQVVLDRTRLRNNNSRSIPEKLFLAIDYGNTIYRSYYRQPGNDLVANLVLNKNDNNDFSAAISLLGESTVDNTSESIRQQDRIYIDMPSYHTSISMHVHDQRLGLYYDTDGAISSIHFGEGENEFVAAKGIQSKNIDIDKLVANEEQIFNNGESMYILNYDNEKEKYYLMHKKNGVIQDEVNIPSNIDRQEIIKKLFSGVILDHPFEADIEFDDEWKSAGLETFGASWKREGKGSASTLLTEEAVGE